MKSARKDQRNLTTMGDVFIRSIAASWNRLVITQRHFSKTNLKSNIAVTSQRLRLPRKTILKYNSGAFWDTVQR